MGGDVVPRKLSAQEIELIEKIRNSADPKAEAEQLISYRDILLRQRDKQPQSRPQGLRGAS